MLALLSLLALALHWQPTRQVRLHQEHLLEAVQNRKWKTAGEFLAEDYRDRWGQTKTDVLAQLPQVFGDFLALGVIGEDGAVSWSESEPTVRERIRIVGSGGPIAQIVMQRSQAFTQPFSFRWRRQSWRPWDWALVEADQPELRTNGFNVDF